MLTKLIIDKSSTLKRFYQLEALLDNHALIILPAFFAHPRNYHGRLRG